MLAEAGPPAVAEGAVVDGGGNVVMMGGLVEAFSRRC